MENKTVHDNPVEIIKKDIYLIRNKINGKGYVEKATNEGREYHRDEEEYQLMKYKNSGRVLLSVEDCIEVHCLLKETDMSLRSIAKQFGVAHNLIMLINSGKSARYRFENEKYPLRKPF